MGLSKFELIYLLCNQSISTHFPVMDLTFITHQYNTFKISSIFLLLRTKGATKWYEIGTEKYVIVFT